MKLLAKGPEAVVLSLTAMDRRLIDAVLSAFEQLPRRDGPISRSGEVPAAEEELLHAALSERRTDQWRWFTELGSTKGAWSRHGREWKLTLPPDRFESLLQMLNDIRVSAWKILGCPADLPHGPFETDTVEGVTGWLMLTTGFLQSNLLFTLEGPVPVPPRKPRKKSKPSGELPPASSAKKPRRPKKD